MEGLVILVLLSLIAIIIVLPIIAILRANHAANQTERLIQRISSLEVEIVRIKERLKQPARPTEPQEASDASRSTAKKDTDRTFRTEPHTAATLLQKRKEASPDKSPPVQGPELLSHAPTAEPPPLITKALPRIQTLPPPPAPDIFARMKGSLNWEQFMGAKLFAWIGGLALFLGVAYFAKYSFEKGWIPPEVRVALGFLIGLGLIAGGVVLRRKEYSITSQTLCATGVVILYAVTFACRAVYHFTFFGAMPTFTIMVLITATAFVIAVRMDAIVVAVLGLLGGFLTPLLLSTGEDLPVTLFSYIAILDAGLIAVALNRRWFFLMPMAASGTVLIQISWTAEFFEQGEYFIGNKVLLPMIVLLGFNTLWLGATWLVKRREETEQLVGISTAALSFVSFAFAFYFLGFDALAARPWLVFGFAFLVDAVVIGLIVLDRRLNVAQSLAGAAVFLLLAVWLNTQNTSRLLLPALAFTLVFGSVHSLLPFALRHIEGHIRPFGRASSLFPSIALIVLLIPIFRFEELNCLIWPVILLVDVLAIALAALTASILPLLAVLFLTFVAAAGVLFNIPAELTGLSPLLFIVAAFAVFFIVAGDWLRRKLAASDQSPELERNLQNLAPCSAIMLPFVLLIMMVGKLPLANPTPVFAVALLLTGLLLASTRMFRLGWLPIVGMACVAALECAWHFRLFPPEMPQTPLLWHLVFYVVFMVFPFVQIQKFENWKGPWIASALAGPVQFFLIHRLVQAAWPNDVMGVLPAAFAVPAMLCLLTVLKRVPATSPIRVMQLALYGAVTLFFITVILPIQFDQQWLTIGLALEGAALCWLFHRVPHPGLRVIGVALLLTAFVRLALNPAVFSYHPRSQFPILNWYLYAYGLVTVILFVGARLLAPPRHLIFNIRAPVILATVGTVLAFLLVNVEIADFFTAPGTTTLTFTFSGSFARDMTYSIAWALFALVLLIFGFARKLAPTRYAAIALLGVTVLKLFFHDLARLQQLYRIGALVGVAIIAIIASFLYQRFMAAGARADGSAAHPTGGDRAQ